MHFRLSRTETIEIRGNPSIFLMYSKSFRPFGFLSKSFWYSRIVLIRIFCFFIDLIGMLCGDDFWLFPNECYVSLVKISKHSNKELNFVFGFSKSLVLIETQANNISSLPKSMASYESLLGIEFPKNVSPKIYSSYKYLDKVIIGYEFILGDRKVVTVLGLVELKFLARLQMHNTVEFPILKYLERIKNHEIIYHALLTLINNNRNRFSTIKTGVSHGDFAPYNIFYLKNSIKAIDWSAAELGCSVFGDIIYYHCAVHSLFKKASSCNLFERIKQDCIKLNRIINFIKVGILPIIIVDLYIIYDKYLAQYPSDPIAKTMFDLTTYVSSEVDQDHLLI